MIRDVKADQKMFHSYNQSDITMHKWPVMRKESRDTRQDTTLMVRVDQSSHAEDCRVSCESFAHEEIAGAIMNQVNGRSLIKSMG